MRRWPDGVSGLAAPALALALVAPPASAQLALSDGQSFQVHLTSEHGDGQVTKRFSVDRTMIFHRTAAGYTIDVTGGPAEASDAVSRQMFTSAMAALTNRTVRFRVDRAGAPLSIDDEGAIWDAFCSAIEATGRPPANGGKSSIATAAALANPMRTASAGVRRSMLFSMVTPQIAGPLADKVPGSSRAVSLPVETPTGETSTLFGVQRVMSGNDDMLLIVTDAEGDLKPWRGPASPAARVKISRMLRIDRGRGLVVESRDRRETVIGTGRSAQRSISVSTMTLKPTVP